MPSRSLLRWLRVSLDNDAPLLPGLLLLVITRLLLVLGLVGATVSAGAARVEFVGRVGEQRIEGGNVCFFRIESEGDFIRRELATKTVRCLPADKIIDLVPGRWHYWIEHESGLLSAVRRYQIAAELSDSRFKRVTLRLRPAGSVRLASPFLSSPSEHAIVWMSTDVGSGAIPFIESRTESRVVAETPFVVLVVEGSEIESVSEILHVRAKRTLTVTRLPPRVETADVVVPVEFSPELVATTSHAIVAPDLELITFDGKRRKADIPAGHSPQSLAIFKNVPRGVVRVEIVGTFWTPAIRAIDLRDVHRGVFTAESMNIAPSSAN
jgi:hypothetical protein